jgi:hypothetical protein
MPANAYQPPNPYESPKGEPRHSWQERAGFEMGAFEWLAVALVALAILVGAALFWEYQWVRL